MKRNQTFAVFLVLAIVVAVLPACSEQPVSAAGVAVSAQQFSAYIRDWSEPEGYFDTDNFISNETSYEQVIEELHSRTHPGGVYIGVGPDQNFTYIAQTHPALAIIIDIRRQNMLQHLFFKALFAQAATRGDYLALLLAKEKPTVKPDAGFQEILDAVRAAPTSEQIFQRHWTALQAVLKGYKVDLSDDDFKKIEYVYRTFWKEGLDLRFSSIGRGNAMEYPTFEDMLLETDRSGHLQNYLSTDTLFQWLKQFESENRVIPIVGDFGGKHAFETVARFLKENGLQVSTFYTSNVEFYLFGTPAWAAFMRNVHALPVGEDSVFIRSYFGSFGRTHPLNVPGHRSTNLVHAIVPFLNDYAAGKIATYWDVVQRSK